jgi:hypothetical protein
VFIAAHLRGESPAGTADISSIVKLKQTVALGTRREAGLDADDHGEPRPGPPTPIMNEREIALVWLAVMIAVALFRCAESQHARWNGLSSGRRFADDAPPTCPARAGWPPGVGSIRPMVT